MSNNVPKLRFKGFSDDWKSVGVNSLFSEVRNGFVGTATPYYVEKGVPYLQSNNIRKNRIDLTKLVHITEEFHNKNKKSILKAGDILMVQSGHSGECAVVPKEFENTNCHALIVMTPNFGVNSLYCSYYINSDIGQNRLFKLITGNTIKHILASEIKEFRIMIPKSEEQEKIANFLTKVDNIIEKQEEKVSTLENYKKGMMQKIFSQEIRFKDENGEEYPEWKEKKIGSLGETYTGLTGKTKDDFGFGNGKYITYMNVFKNTKIDLNIIEQVNIVENERQNNVEAGDLLFTTSSETPKEVGMVSVCNKSCENLYLNSFCFGFRLNNLENINCEFMAYLMRSPKSRAKISILAQGSTRYNLSKTELLKMIIKIPCLEEQTKISNFFSNIDEILEKEKEKLEELRLWKKGLLQQMFV